SSWQFIGWLASLKTCAAASRALSFLLVVVLSAAAGAAAVCAAASWVRFLGLACVAGAGLAAAVLLSGLGELTPLRGVVLVAWFFFLVAIMHLLRERDRNRAARP